MLLQKFYFDYEKIICRDFKPILHKIPCQDLIKDLPSLKVFLKIKSESPICF